MPRVLLPVGERDSWPCLLPQNDGLEGWSGTRDMPDLPGRGRGCGESTPHPRLYEAVQALPIWQLPRQALKTKKRRIITFLQLFESIRR
jgi:hypothetical protein